MSSSSVSEVAANERCSSRPSKAELLVASGGPWRAQDLPIKSTRDVLEISTASLEALKRNRRATEFPAAGDNSSAIAQSRAATALDPDFAAAFSTPGTRVLPTATRVDSASAAWRYALSRPERLTERMQTQAEAALAALEGDTPLAVATCDPCGSAAKIPPTGAGLTTGVLALPGRARTIRRSPTLPHGAGRRVLRVRLRSSSSTSSPRFSRWGAWTRAQETRPCAERGIAQGAGHSGWRRRRAPGPDGEPRHCARGPTDRQSRDASSRGAGRGLRGDHSRRGPCGGDARRRAEEWQGTWGRDRDTGDARAPAGRTSGFACCWRG